MTELPNHRGAGAGSHVSITASSSYSREEGRAERKFSNGGSTLTANSSADTRQNGKKKKLGEQDDDAIGPADERPFDNVEKDPRGPSPSPRDIETGSAAEISLSAPSVSSLVDWIDSTDPQNPKNFHPRTKFLIGMNIGLMNFIVSFAISVFSVIASEAGYNLGETGGDSNILQMGVSSFILGLAFGPVFFGPASEYYGRKRPLVLGMSGFVTFTGLVPMLNNVEAIVLCRLLAGFCGSVAYVIPPGMFVDLYGPVGRAVGYSIFATGAFIGGSMGPGVGASMVLRFHFNWSTTMIGTAMFAMPLIIGMVFLPETLEAIILQRKSRRLRLQTGDWSLHCRRDEVPVELRDYLLKPWRILFQEPVLVVVTIAFTLDYGIQSLTYSAIPAAFEMPRHWSVEPSAWALGITVVGFLIGCITVVMDTKVRFQKKLLEGGPIPPEKRLPPIILGMAILSLGLLFFAWKSTSSAHWREQAFGEVMIGQGMYMVWVTATVYVQDLYVGHANSALAACAFVRYALGAAFPMFATPMYDRLGIQWAIALLGILCAVLVPFHVLFYFKGETIRRWSKFAIHGGIGPGIGNAEDRSSSALRERQG